MAARKKATRLRRVTAAERRAEIIRIASNLFEVQSFSGTAIRDIALAAGVNQALLYQHFSSKEELFTESFVKPTAEIRARLFTALGDVACAALVGDSRLEALNAELLEATISALPSIGALVYADPTVARQSFDEHYGMPHRDATDRVVRFTSENGIDMSRVTAQYYVTVLFGMNLGYALHDLFGGQPVESDEFSHGVSTILRQGLLDHPASRYPSGTELAASAAGSIAPPAASREAIPNDDRRAALLAAARGVFAERGRTRATVKVIAQRAGVSEPTLYRYFESKQHLFDSSMLEPFQLIASDTVRLGSAFEGILGAARLPLGLQVHERMIVSFREITPLLLISLFSDRKSGTEFYGRRLEPLLAQVAQALDLNMSDTAHTRTNAQALMLVLVGMHVSAATFSRYDETPVDDLLLAGIISYIASFGAGSIHAAQEALSIMRAVRADADLS